MLRDDEIVRLLTLKPEKGLEKLMDGYTGLAFSIVYGKLSNICSKEDIEECVSDIFYEIYKNRDSIDPEKGSLKALLCVISKRKAIDLYRKAIRQNQKLPAEEMENEPAGGDNYGVETAVINNETKNLLISEIKALGEPDSEIIIRKYYFGQSTKLIAKDLRLKENTVDKKVSRGLNKLRLALGGILT